MTFANIAAAILLATAIAGAQEIPAGTALPAMLTSTLDASKAKADQPITARIEQDVPLPNGEHIPANSRITGRVLQTQINPDGSSYVRIRFDVVHTKHGDIPVSTKLRAIASWWAVQGAQMPNRAPAWGDMPSNWTTVQVGDDVVYRGGGPVMNDGKVVGEPVYRGVLSELAAVPEPGCETSSNQKRLALWVFSSAACGAYGFGDLNINRESVPEGEIVLTSQDNVKVEVRSGLLLITTETSRR